MSGAKPQRSLEHNSAPSAVTAISLGIRVGLLTQPTESRAPAPSPGAARGQRLRRLKSRPKALSIANKAAGHTGAEAGARQPQPPSSPASVVPPLGSEPPLAAAASLPASFSAPPEPPIPPSGTTHWPATQVVGGMHKVLHCEGTQLPVLGSHSSPAPQLTPSHRSTQPLVVSHFCPCGHATPLHKPTQVPAPRRRGGGRPDPRVPAGRDQEGDHGHGQRARSRHRPHRRHSGGMQSPATQSAGWTCRQGRCRNHRETDAARLARDRPGSCAGGRACRRRSRGGPCRIGGAAHGAPPPSHPAYSKRLPRQINEARG